MSKVKSAQAKKIIPFDQPIKIALLFFHFIGFSVWYGGLVIGIKVLAIFPAMMVISGMFLFVRELYKDGLVWLIVTEGTLNIIKILLLVLSGVLMKYKVSILSLVMLCGLLSSHLPQQVRERRIL
jgi:hypothetical protein